MIKFAVFVALALAAIVLVGSMLVPSMVESYNPSQLTTTTATVEPPTTIGDAWSTTVPSND